MGIVTIVYNGVTTVTNTWVLLPLYTIGVTTVTNTWVLLPLYTME